MLINRSNKGKPQPDPNVVKKDPLEVVKPYHWKPGQSGNPGGKTSEQRKLEIQNAARATRIRSALLMSVEHTIERAIKDAARQMADAATSKRLTIDDGTDKEQEVPDITRMITSDILRLIKDSEDRGLGAPEKTFHISDADKPDEQLLQELKIVFESVGVKLDLPMLLGMDDDD